MSDRTLDQFFKPKKKKEPKKEEELPKEEPIPPEPEVEEQRHIDLLLEADNTLAKHEEEVQDVEEPKDVHIPGIPGDGFIHEPPLTEPEVEESKQEEPTPEDLVQCQICGNKFEPENIWAKNPDVCKNCFIPGKEIRDDSPPPRIMYLHLRYKVEVTYLDPATRFIKALVPIPYHGLEIGETMVVDARALNTKQTRF